MSEYGKILTERGTLTNWRRQRMDLSGHGNEHTEQGALTFWRQQKEALVRTQNESHQRRRSHLLEAEEGGACQNTERIRPRKAITNWRQRMEELVRTRRQTDRARRTHFLETTEGGTCQDVERNRSSEMYSPTGNSGRSKLSGHGKKYSERGTLTSWRQQREELVRTWKEIDRARHTHFLKTADGKTC